jgi:outer membrane protein
MNRLAFVVVTLILGIPLAAAQDASRLTLEQAISIGKDRSNTLRASQARARVSDARANEVDAALLPSVKVDASYRRLSNVPSFSVALPIPGFTPIAVFPNIPDNYVLHASVQQPLFTGFRLSSNAKAAELQSEAGQLDVRNDETDLIIQITSAYWGLYQSREVKRSIDENVTSLETYERDVHNLMNAGMATRNDLLRIQVQLSNARLGQIDAANDMQVAEMSLNLALGRPVNTPVEIASQPRGIVDTAVGTSAGLLASALTRRPDIAAMQTRIDASRAGVTAANAGWWPQLSLAANYYYSNPNQRFLPAMKQWNDSWDVGVQLQWDVWNWGTTKAQAEQAEAGLEANQAVFDQMKQNVALEVERTSLAAARAAQKVEVAKLGVAQAEENSRIMGDKFRSGLATSSELLDANVALLQARTNLTGSLAEQEITAVRLQKALGVLR